MSCGHLPTARPHMRQLTHWIASVAFVATLCLPLLQTATGALPNAGLGGVVKPLAPLDPSLAAWNEGSLQHAIEDRVRRNLGLRDWMIRTDNELRMQAFGSAKRPILANEDAWLLEEGYLPTKILARESGIVDELLTRACNLRRLQDALSEHGVQLAVVISPSKVWTYPERVASPHGDAIAAMTGSYTYPEVLRAGLDESGVRHFDFGSIFREWKATDGSDVPPLFPRGGIHWSNHASARAAVLIQDAMEKVARTDFRSIEIARIAKSNKPGGGEDDLALLANLLDTTTWQEPIGQPIVQARANDQGKSMATLLVGTSFLWGIARAFACDGACDPLTVWYYFKSEYRYVDGKQGKGVAMKWTPAELKKQMLRYEVILVEGNESATPGFGQGFVEAALEALGIDALKEPEPEFLHRITQRTRVTR